MTKDKTLDDLNSGKTVESSGSEVRNGEIMERKTPTLEEIFADMDRHTPALANLLRAVNAHMQKYGDR